MCFIQESVAGMSRVRNFERDGDGESRDEHEELQVRWRRASSITDNQRCTDHACKDLLGLTLDILIGALEAL